MTKFAKILTIMFAFVLAPLFLSHAITVQVAPNPVEVNQPVTVTATANFPSIPNCQLKINFDDGSPPVDLGARCNSDPCIRTTTHTFDLPKRVMAKEYTIQVYSDPSDLMCKSFGVPQGPDPGKVKLIVEALPPPLILCPTPKVMPGATAGIPYKHRLRATGGTPPFQYAIVHHRKYSDKLPPGLTMSRSGRISGVPARAGTFKFMVRIQDKLKQIVECPFSITVGTAPLTIRETPNAFTIHGFGPATRIVTYSFSSNRGINTSVTSQEGMFQVGGQKFKNTRKLTARLTNGAGKVVESISIPAAIIRKAWELGVLKFFYYRTFASDLTKSANSQITFSITKDAVSPLEITGIRLYFDNKRPKITVKRNQKGLKAFAEIQFKGAGVLNSHFEVDRQFHSRIVKYVNSKQKRTVIFETPAVPPLRTFDEGAHRVRLVINQPKMEIAIPEIIYYVVAVSQLSVVLDAPENRAEIDPSKQTFSWSKPKQNLVYRIEFSFKSGGPPAFSAETDKNEYNIPKVLVKSKIPPGAEIFWRVKAFDKKGSLTGISEERSFISMLHTSHVPGQIIIGIEDTERTQTVLKALGDKYGLRLLNVYDLISLKQKMAVFHTTEEIWPIIETIKKEPSMFLAQPNFIFKTMADPLSHMQNTYRVMHLEKLHSLHRGKGVLISIVDTGADTSHEDLRDRITRYENLVDQSPYRGEIHGTATASLIAASLNGFGMVGVAPEADLMILRACRQVSGEHPEGECYTTSIARALDIAIQERSNVVNMSVGSAATDFLISRLLDAGREKGVLWVAPVGNQPHQETLVFPASHPAVLAVAGLTDLGKPYPNSVLAKLAGAQAPATNVLAAVPGQAHRLLSGTSMASATIAGLIAMAYERDHGIDVRGLPPFRDSLCGWEEDLLEIKICDE